MHLVALSQIFSTLQIISHLVCQKRTDRICDNQIFYNIYIYMYIYIVIQYFSFWMLRQGKIMRNLILFYSFAIW